MAKDTNTEELVKAEILRDYWESVPESIEYPEGTRRVRAGEIIEVTKDALIEGQEAGVLRRVK